MSAYFKLGSLFKGIATTATAAGTTTLTNASRQYQQFTGTATQIVVLPNATTLSNSRRFDILNRSTGIVTVNFNGGSLAATVPADSQRYFLLVNNGTAAGSWVVGGVVAGGSGVVSTADKLNLLSGLAGLNVSTDSIEGRVLKLNPEEQGGNYWLTRTPVAVAKCWPSNFSLNGFIYNAFGVNNSSVNTATSERFDIDSNYFLSRATGITIGNTRAPFVLSGRGYVVGGDPLASVLNAMEAYNDSLNSWATRAAAPGSSFYGASSWVLDNYGYVAGGQGSGTTTYIYDGVANAWYSRAPIPTSTTRTGQGDSAYNGFGYLVSGTGVATFRKFDPALNFYSLAPALSVGHGMGGVSPVSGFLIVSGGENTGGTAVTTVERYLEGASAWQTVSSITAARYGGGGQFAGQFMHISNGTGTGAAVTTVEAYTSHSMFSLGSLKKSTAVPTSILAATLTNALANNLPVQIRSDGNNWKTLASGLDSVLKQGENLIGKFQYSPEIYFAGGTGGITLNNKFDDNANSWTARQALPVGANSGSSFAIGGYGFSLYDDTTQLVTQRYDSITNTWATRTSILDDNEFGSDGTGWTLAGIGYYAGGESLDATNDSLQSFNDTTNTWTQRTNSTNPHRRAVGFGLFDSLGFCGNNIVGLTTSIERYDPITNAWTGVTNITNRRDNAAGANLEEKGYVIGGSSNGASVNAQDSIYEYSHNSNAWTTKTTIGYTVMFIGAQYNQDNIFWAGGLNNAGTTLTNTRKFNPLANTITTRTGLTTASFDARNHASGPYRNYEVRVGIPAFYAGVGEYVVVARATQTSQDQSAGSLAGYFVSGPNATVLSNIYDLDANSWRRIGDTTTSFDNSGGASLSGFGYMWGTPATSTTVNVLNPSTWTWSTGAAKATALTATKGCALDGFLFSMRGFNGSSAVTTVQRFDQSANTWSNVGNTTTAGYTSGVGAAAGFLFVCGTVGGSSVVERYNPVDNTKVNVTAYPLSISYNAFHGHLGSIWGIGGFAGANVSNVYEYKPEQNVWNVKPSLGTARNSVSHGSFGSDFMVGGGSGSTANERFVNSVKQAVLGLALEVK